MSCGFLDLEDPRRTYILLLYTACRSCAAVVVTRADVLLLPAITAEEGELPAPAHHISTFHEGGDLLLLL